MNYDRIGKAYSSQRRPDPRIQQRIDAELTGCKSVLNVGAGTGSYEPQHIPTVAVEPSKTMIRQRSRPTNAVQAVAEALPFPDNSFDAVLAILTIHHWTDWQRGLRECVRCARKRVIFFTWDPASAGFWLTQRYFPEIIQWDRKHFPSMAVFRQHLGPVTVTELAIPADCADGILGAYWRRPEAYLQPEVRSGMSAFSHLPDADKRLQTLRQDLDSGVWQSRVGANLPAQQLNMGYKLVCADLPLPGKPQASRVREGTGNQP